MLYTTFLVNLFSILHDGRETSMAPGFSPQCRKSDFDTSSTRVGSCTEGAVEDEGATMEAIDELSSSCKEKGKPKNETIDILGKNRGVF